MAKTALIVISVLLVLMLLAIYDFIPFLWIQMLAVIFIVVGFALTFLFAGTGKEDMKHGLLLIFLGIILYIAVYILQPILTTSGGPLPV